MVLIGISNVHLITPPQMVRLNGFVCTFKQSIRAGERESIPFDQRLEFFLLMYRITPPATTGVPPCKLFLGRDLRTTKPLKRHLMIIELSPENFLLDKK